MGTERTGMLTPEPSQTARDPLRRLAQLNVAVVAISTALVVLVALGLPDDVERTALATALGAALAGIAGLLFVTSPRLLALSAAIVSVLSLAAQFAYIRRRHERR